MFKNLYNSIETTHFALFKKPVTEDWAFKVWLVIAAIFTGQSLIGHSEIFSDPAYFFSAVGVSIFGGLLASWLFSAVWLLPRYGYHKLQSNYGLFQNSKKSLAPKKVPNSFPVNLPDGTQVQIDRNSTISEEFIFRNFTTFEEKILKHEIFDWNPDLLQRMTEQMYMQDYIELAKGISQTYYEIAPIRVSNAFLKLSNTVGIGILSEDALTFFWETRNRFNIAVLFNYGVREIIEIDDFKFKATIEEAICRRSPSPETIPVSEWTFSPVISDYAPKNTDSLKLFFSLILLQDKYLSSENN